MRHEPARAWRLWFAVIAVAGVVVVASALVSGGGNLFGDVTVRGGTVPSVLVVTLGVALTAGGTAGWFWRRD
ncbi:hypothetical protein FVA74_11055 [Salinibacterium sp. dk2585]|uniref:hypothetical protein n=1 Tax=unclassified Salinibacterium TaxID=2632331 RepID=UPI0011C252CC|nr:MULTISPECIES: hypothetical protein [unclassified Salinibacterium]QEE62043.1 hypothetical protein FVA74_11055 [Salinibacterium sp. dk2585]TXK52211.1 hypothetical protein FVP63_13370 [Salinibacterium sp. dk5596]